MNVNEFVTLVRGSFPELTPGQESMFRAMEPLYNDWNSRINVISRKDIDACASFTGDCAISESGAP